jgi:hypothetical protein
MTPINGGILNRLSSTNVSLEIIDPVDPKALERAKTILNEILQTKGSVNGKRLVAVSVTFFDFEFFGRRLAFSGNSQYLLSICCPPQCLHGRRV